MRGIAPKGVPASRHPRSLAPREEVARTSGSAERANLRCRNLILRPERGPVPEPVLRRLASEIGNDEVRHYKHFYHYFLRYREREQPSRLAVLKTLWHRLDEVDAEDAYYAFKHVFLTRHPELEFNRSRYDTFRRGVRDLGKDHYPYSMAMKMLLKPLDLGNTFGRVAVPAMSAATRLLLFR